MRDCPAYMKAYKKNLEGRRCACSRPATMHFRGEFICEECHAIHVADANRRYQKTVGIVTGKHIPKQHVEDKWDGTLEGFQKEEAFGWGPTEQFLQKLDEAA